MIPRVVALGLLVLIGGCGPLARLRSDLRQIDQNFRRGRADLQFVGNQPAVLVIYAQDRTATVELFDIVRSAGPVDLWLPAKPLNAFAFVDGNGDLGYQPGEACASARFDPRSTAVSDIALRLPDEACTENDAPPQMADGQALQWTQAAPLHAYFAEVTTLDDPRFSPEQATAGLWQPLEFVKSNSAGLFMLEPYDPNRVPVLFVHGMVGSPRDFRYLIQHLDTRRFQPWVLSYPSGMALEDLASATYRTLARTRYKLQFDELHIVAHSMGGLVTRGFINECSRARDCAYLKSFTSIASPFGGHAGGQWALDLAPAVAPAWRDMAPGSPYLRTLFSTPLPNSLPYNLLFAFHRQGMAKASSDGTIELQSQLRPEAQAEAATVRGFDETHMSVLSSAAVTRQIAELLME